MSENKIEQREIIQFASVNEVPRTFIISNKDNVIDIIDVDNDSVICKDVMSERKPIAKMMAVMMLSEYSWKEFAYYVTNRPEYQGGSDDLTSGMELPEGGKVEMYAKYNIRMDDGVDIRPEGARTGDKVTRAQVIKRLMSHETKHLGNGKSAISWNVAINDNWDLSGKPVNGNGEEISEDFDEAWSEFIENGEALEEAQATALKTYLKDTSLSRSTDGNSVWLKTLAGNDMTFSSMSELEEKLEQLSDAELYKAFQKCAKLDIDLYPSSWQLTVQTVLNEMRTEMETNDGPEELSLY